MVTSFSRETVNARVIFVFEFNESEFLGCTVAMVTVHGINSTYTSVPLKASFFSRFYFTTVPAVKCLKLSITTNNNHFCNHCYNNNKVWILCMCSNKVFIRVSNESQGSFACFVVLQYVTKSK